MRHHRLAWLVGVWAAWAGSGVTGAAQASAAERAVMQAIDQIKCRLSASRHQSVRSVNHSRVRSDCVERPRVQP